jgi:CheY-like chemotaxis protein
VPATLLLADDSITIQRVIELTFADEDVRVVAVSDGEEAIARLESSPPDIVLADVGMPGKSGYDVAQHVKRTPRLAHIPVVLLTGAFEPIDRTRAALVGCDGVLAKPFEPQLVIARVKELLEQRPAQAVPSAPAARRTDLDDYFDQLDAAFANLASNPTARKQAPPPEPQPAAPLSYASALADFEPDPDGPEEDLDAPVDPAPRAEIPAALPSISEAFAALLAAEKNELPTANAPLWPPRPVGVPPLDDQTINRIAKLVAEQLSDRAIREIVGEIVTATAERLVREEIERIKATIK